MKKYFAWIVTFVVAMSLVFCFVGCKGPADPNFTEPPVEKPNDELVTELKPIGFKISLPKANRASYYSQDDASSYVVKLTRNGTAISTQNGTPGQTLTFTVEQEGTYTINVEAYNTEKTLIAEGSASRAITFADGYVSVVVALYPKEKPSDPSNPPVINKVDIGVDIQWVQPDDRILTVQTSGNSYFRRWFSDSSLGNTVVLEFTSGMTLYDIFRANDVSFWLDSYEKNGKKYEFTYRYLDSYGNEYNENSMLTEDITLSPEFRIVPKVTFNLNGGNIDGDTSDKVEFRRDFNRDYPYRPTKDNLSFVGWTLTPDGDAFITWTEEDITVYAKYIEVKDCTLTVTTNENSYFYSYKEGDLGTSITLEFTSGMTLREIFENNYIEYYLNDYYLNDRLYEHSGYQDGNQNKYNSDTPILCDLELSAIWVRLSKITWNLNGGNINGDTSDRFTYCDLLYDIPVKEGYVIEAWTLTLDGDDYLFSADGEFLGDEVLEYEFEEKLENGEDFTLYAKWAEPETCTLTLSSEYPVFRRNSTGENLGSSLTLEFTQGTTLGDILRNNDILVGSFTDDDGTLYEFNGDYIYYIEFNWSTTYYESSVLLESIELIPRVNKIPQVTFNLNGGNIDGDTSDVMVYTNYFSINYNPAVQPTKEGYILIGWTLTPDGDDIVESADSNITVYAKWADALQLFESGDIVGDFAADGLALTYEGEGIYTTEFVYAEDMNVWGSELGTIAFKLRPTAGDWSTSYGMVSTPILDGEEGQISLSSANNIIVSGFEEGVTYRITVRCTEMGEVFVRVSTVE